MSIRFLVSNLTLIFLSAIVSLFFSLASTIRGMMNGFFVSDVDSVVVFLIKLTALFESIEDNLGNREKYLSFPGEELLKWPPDIIQLHLVSKQSFLPGFSFKKWSKHKL